MALKKQLISILPFYLISLQPAFAGPAEDPKERPDEDEIGTFPY